ncbi:MAG: hypothetical protein ACYDD6_12505 [Acidimicrobiales bacterium]
MRTYSPRRRDWNPRPTETPDGRPITYGRPGQMTVGPPPGATFVRRQCSTCFAPLPDGHLGEDGACDTCRIHQPGGLGQVAALSDRLDELVVTVERLAATVEALTKDRLS